uniref:Uncharacterized protein n=1 Tax=Chromera velia CCMP2878 TaxID=1169474 RepID=A0A0G4I856_9ALVE|eukprot:Cvel_11863.t1-p1 / transcript=Cvel_11863.t1 / gene=Cvel_11863 / organism=Chromera_velia_CCMP2878 / gene_product=hypothetical protein / transcript_product=hypothetical protein / location=Cvel_scaffold756:66013-66789(+) / protein_length=259 / sequence_SO=supercontig / SO=protein_coding / is_pseudo=false
MLDRSPAFRLSGYMEPLLKGVPDDAHLLTAAFDDDGWKAEERKKLESLASFSTGAAIITPNTARRMMKRHPTLPAGTTQLDFLKELAEERKADKSGTEGGPESQGSLEPPRESGQFGLPNRDSAGTVGTQRSSRGITRDQSGVIKGSASKAAMLSPRTSNLVTGGPKQHLQRKRSSVQFKEMPVTSIIAFFPGSKPSAPIRRAATGGLENFEADRKKSVDEGSASASRLTERRISQELVGFAQDISKGKKRPIKKMGQS